LGVHLIRKRTPHGPARRAEIDRQIEFSQDRGKPPREIVGGALDQERRGPKRRRPRTARAQQRAVEDHGMRHRPIVGVGRPPPKFISAASCRP
jgi:hypothetical protein